MKVFYVLSDLPDWIALAKNMHKEKGWEPVYWVMTKKLIPELQKTFSFTEIDDFMQLNQGNIPSYSLFVPLDDSIIRQYLPYEKNALDMMRRLDPDGKSFTYDERIALYYKHLHYALALFKKYAPLKILFNESPHSPFTYVLYSVAKEQGVEIIRFSPSHIDARVLVSSTVEKTSLYFREKYIQNKKSSKIDLDESLQGYIQRLQGDYKTALPSYMKPILEKTPKIVSLMKNIKKALHFIVSPPDLYFYTKSPIFHSKLRGIWFLYYKIKGDIFKRNLHRSYQKYVENVDLSSKYIYVPLHYQPEKTTNPEGGVFSDQSLMISLLAQTVPKGWKIFVKEHPSQFSSRLEGERGRTEHFYRDILKFENVCLASLSVSSFDLIDASQAVAVVTGTAALESVIRSKPALIFGNVWFQDCEGICMCKTHADVEKAISNLESYSIEQQNIIAFFNVLQEYSLPAYLNPGNKSYTQLSVDENVSNLTKLLLQHEKYAHE